MNTDKDLIFEANVTGFDLMQSKILNFNCGDCIFKKCCEKYKKGKRCKKCPKTS